MRFLLIMVLALIGSFIPKESFSQIDSVLNLKNLHAVWDQYYVLTQSNKFTSWNKYKNQNGFKRSPMIEKQIANHMFGDTIIPEDVYFSVSTVSTRRKLFKILDKQGKNKNNPKYIFRVKIYTPEFNYWANLYADVDTNILNLTTKLPHHSKLKYSLYDLCVKLGTEYLDSNLIYDYSLDFVSDYPNLIHIFKCNRRNNLIIQNKKKMSGIEIEKYTKIKMNSYTSEIIISEESDTTEFWNLSINF